jgi:hypothetical protein
MPAVLIIKYLRMCFRCHIRKPLAGFRKILGKWHCPACATEVLGPVRCRVCGEEILAEQPRVRLREHEVAHCGCYYCVTVHEDGV